MILLQWLPLSALSGRETRVPKLQSLDRVVLLDWSDTGVNVCEAVKRADVWELGPDVLVPWESGKAGTGLTSDQQGTILREALVRHGISATHAVVSAPRRKSVIKLLELPGIEDSLLPAAVALQAESRGHSAEEFVIDYLPQPTNEMQPRYVLMVAYHREAIGQLEQAGRHAGLELCTIGIGELAYSSLLGPEVAPSPPASSESPDRLSLLIFANADSIDFLVTRLGQPVSSFTMPSTSDPDRLASVVSTSIRRVLTSLPAAVSTGGIQAIALGGTNAQQLGKSLETKYQMQYRFLEPPTLGAARAWSLLRQHEQRLATIDFLHPRKNGDPALAQRQVVKTWLIRAALTLVLVSLIFRMWLTHLDSQANALNATIRELQSEATLQESVLETEAQIRAWSISQVDWPVELVDFLKQLPSNERIFLKRLRLDGTLDQTPSIKMEGFARELEDAFAVSRKLLAQSPRYQLQPENFDRNDQDPHYQIRFEITVMIREPAEVQEGTSLPGDEEREAPTSESIATAGIVP